MKNAPIPPDDLNRSLSFTDVEDPQALHIGLVGDTYTVIVAGKDTNDHFCVIDMHVAPGGGPGPHRHDFEESFVLQDGEIEFTFRGEKRIVRAGQSINIPANAPHSFRNISAQAARMLCICAPAGEERFFEQLGVRVAGRTTPPPALDEEQEAAFRSKAEALAPEFRTGLLPPE